MPLLGGAAAKSGDRYEGRWAAHCLLDVLRGDAHRIRFEPPGPDGEGVEFWLQRLDHREYWQVKRQQAGKAGWTPGDLTSVLQAFWTHLQSGSICVFASTQSVRDIPELADRAQRSKDYSEFVQHFLDSEQLRKTFLFLATTWDASAEDAYDAVQRISIATVDEEQFVRLLRSSAELLLDGEPMTAVDVLTALALDSAHIELTSADVLAHLESRGHHRRNWNEHAVFNRVRGQAAECFRGFEGSELSYFNEMVESFLSSAAFAEHHFDLLRALDETTASMPDIMCKFCERFVEKIGGEAGDIRTAVAAHADMVCRLALKAYASTREADIRRRALDMIDQMMRYNYYGLEQAIGAYSV